MTKKDTLSKLKQQEREIREDLIIDAARTVFGAKTYDKVSMQEIANAAGIAKSSIYTYFKNQEALFVEAAYRDTQRFISELETRLQEKDDTQKLDALIAHFLEYNTRNEVYWQMITRFSLYGEISGESSRKLDVVARRFMDLLDLVFSGATSEADKRLLSHTLFAALSGILIAFRKYPGRSEDQSLAHMQRVGRLIKAMFDVYLQQPDGTSTPQQPS
ncbi:MAG: TetR/AcrR family transcriptional regulator [Desulfobacteraceae bacterium]|nr:TetR/AcrR family transcriptional regulator [Desulfobacteraceae bacterium]MBC2749730.1 TetR/AcrR family transcriptional regulator [Desulfobacteraceae bacterium]